MFYLKKRNPFELVNIVALSVMCCCCLCIKLTDVTNQFFKNNGNCVIAAFGDFNSDKYTDVFCLKNDGKTLEILISQNPKEIQHNIKLVCSVGEKETITSIMPADYNGDSMLDVLITVGTESKQKIDVRILWGSQEQINCTSTTNFPTRSQPLIMDFNGDMIPDVFTEHDDGKRYFYSVKKTSLERKELSKLPYKQELSNPHSCAFIDLNDDFESDLFITGKNSMEYWFRYQDDRSIPSFNLSEEIQYPPEYEFRGQSSFIDINGDSIMEHIIPVCKKGCKCSLMIRSLNTTDWKILLESFGFANESWCFKHSTNLFGPTELPATLQNADFDMDGMPDVLTVMTNEAGSNSRAVLLKNVPCPHCPFGRTLVPLWDLLSSVRDVVLVAFFDIFEDGVIDIILNTKTGSNFKLHALQNMFSKDAYFIKVLVLGGLCYDTCPGGHQAYGVNQPGPCITYKTTGPDGTERTGRMVQLSQSAHFALQLPYSIFGLGQTPNFLDELQVVIPGGYRNELRQRTWTQIIPNSQIVVIPFPSDNSKFWVAKLFVTPSHSILLTFAALVGTCLFICLIVGALHWKERRADRRERLLEAHRFHFDAM